MTPGTKGHQGQANGLCLAHDGLVQVVDQGIDAIAHGKTT
jgi:hypothetical protein